MHDSEKQELRPDEALSNVEQLECRVRGRNLKPKLEAAEPEWVTGCVSDWATDGRTGSDVDTR
jgi:hypothetical protein